jgi:hypothetical protein
MPLFPRIGRRSNTPPNTTPTSGAAAPAGAPVVEADPSSCLPKIRLRSCFPARAARSTNAAASGRASAPRASLPAAQRVSRTTAHYMNVGNDAMRTVKEILSLGPTNQLFANAATGGTPQIHSQLLYSAQKLAQAPDTARENAHTSFNIFTQYAAQHLVAGQIVASSPSFYDPQLSTLAAAAGTGICNNYATMTAILTAQALHQQGQPFEVLVCALWGDVDTATGENAPHAVALVRAPGESGNAQTVALDSWVQNSAARPLADTNYPRDRAWGTDEYDIKIVMNAPGSTPEVHVRNPKTGEHQPIAFNELPTESVYRAVQGSMSAADFESFVGQNPTASAMSALQDWAKNTATQQAIFGDQGRKISRHAEALRYYHMYQQEGNATLDAPTLYKSPSGSLAVEVPSITFPGAVGLPVERQVQDAADQNALTLEPVRATQKPEPPQNS